MTTAIDILGEDLNYREVITLDEFKTEARDGIRDLAHLMRRIPDGHEIVVCGIEEDYEFENLGLKNPEGYYYGFAIMSRKVEEAAE